MVYFLYLQGCQSTANKSAETHESTQKTSLSTALSNSTTTSTQQATTQTISKTYQSLSDIPKTLTEEKQTWQLLSVDVKNENQLEAIFIPETDHTQAKDEWTEKYTDLKAIPKDYDTSKPQLSSYQSTIDWRSIRSNLYPAKSDI